MTAEQMWHAYCESSGVSEQTPYSAWAFCGGGAVGDELADLCCTLDVATVLAACLELSIDGGSAHQSASGNVIDDLSVDVGVGTGHAQTRTRGGTGDLAANATLTASQFLPLKLLLIHCFLHSL